MRATVRPQATPVNDDSTMAPSQFLDLSSGYVQRAVDRFPKQGSRMPWQVHQSYLRAYRTLKRSAVTDEVLVFSNTAPAASHQPERKGVEAGTRELVRVDRVGPT